MAPRSVGTMLNRAPRRQAVLDFIKAEIAAGRGFPTARDIGERMGWKRRYSAYDCLSKLEYYDHVLKRRQGSGKTIIYDLVED